MIRREKNENGVEWGWVKSEKGAEGYILGARLQERDLQGTIFDSVAESEWFFHLIHIMAENAHADKVHGIIVMLLSASFSCDKIMRSLVSARPACNVVEILADGLESCAVAVGSCATIKVLLRVLHFHMIDFVSQTTISLESWIIAAQRVLNCMYTILFETDPVTPDAVYELGISFDFLQRLLSWSAAQHIVRQKLLPARVFTKRKTGEELTFLAALQQLLSVIAVGGTGGALSRIMTSRVEPTAHLVVCLFRTWHCIWCLILNHVLQADRLPVASLTSLVHLLLAHHLKVVNVTVDAAIIMLLDLREFMLILFASL
jgi:hypothetical protein